MFHVLISDPIQEEGIRPILEDERLDVIQSSVSNEEVNLEIIDALIVRSGTQVTKDLLEKMPSLQIIGRAGVGIDNIDLDEATKRGVIVINAPDGNTISTAEHTFAMMISLLRNIPQATYSLKHGEWNRKKFLGHELKHQRLGIIGFGRIGSELAKRAKAFEMEVRVYDPFLTEDRAKKHGVESGTLDDILATSDIITVHTPLTKDTKNLINEERLNQTKKGVYILNCARGGIIDEKALEKAIQSGHVTGAALDVYEEEPAVNHSLFTYDEVIATPHIAASTQEAQTLVARQISEEFIRYLNGSPLTNVINLPQIPAQSYQKLEPYFHLTKMMGRFISQCMKVPVKSVTVTYGGQIVNEETTGLSRMFLSAFLQERVDQVVNEVNALQIANERDISFTETKQSEAYGYTNMISAEIAGRERTFEIQATYIPEIGHRIVGLNGYDIDFYPKDWLIYIEHKDQPGVIGHVGRILAADDLNIATMVVGRKNIGGEAIMILSFDREIPEHTIEELDKLSEISLVQSIHV